MPFRALDPESSVSTNSTTWAGGGYGSASIYDDAVRRSKRSFAVCYGLYAARSGTGRCKLQHSGLGPQRGAGAVEAKNSG
jgi:hypothetical protein